MAATNERFGQQLLGIENCPHCGVASPLFLFVWQSDGHTPRTDGRLTQKWGAFRCSSCGGVVTVACTPGDKAGNPFIVAMFPSEWAAKAEINKTARNYLNQAHKTLASPDASVVMSASSIDAMLKDHGVGKDKGSLFQRIDHAVAEGILTHGMAEWAHRVRLDANKPRHADDDDPHMDGEDAERAFEFAKTIAEILYVIPSRMPSEKSEGQV